MKYSFQNIEAWQRSRELVKNIYQLTSVFPKKESYRFPGSFQQLSIYLSWNTIEGSIRGSKNDKTKFYEIELLGFIEILNQRTSQLMKSINIGIKLNSLCRSAMNLIKR